MIGQEPMGKLEFTGTAHNFFTRHRRPLLGAAIIFIFAIFTCGIFAAHRIHNYTSDDVAQQTVLLNSGKYGPQEAWIGVDNFIIKLPFYQVIHSTLGESRTALLVTVVAFNTVAFLGLTAAFFIVWRDQLWGMRKKTAAPIVLGLVGFLWIASLGGDLAIAFVNPNVRNAEVGICIFLAVLTLFWAKRKKAPWWGTALISLLIGVLVYSDPYFLYTVFLPLAAVPAYYFFFDKKNAHAINAARLYVVLGASFILYKLADLCTGALGFNIYHPDVTFAAVATFGTNIINVVSSFLSVFHGNFFGNIANIDTMVLVINAGLALVFMALAAAYITKRRLTSPYAVLFGLTAFVTIILYAITTNSDSIYTVRYLALVPYAVLFLIPFVLAEMQNIRLKILLVGLMLVASIGNTLTIVRIAYNNHIPSDQLSNTQNTIILGQLGARGLEKGYAGYWDGNIHTYLSRGKYVTIPVVCNDKKELQIYYWLMDDAWLKKRADTSYLITDTLDDSFVRCDKSMIENQFGPPKETTQLDARRTLMVFDYDIYTRMPARTDTTRP